MAYIGFNPSQLAVAPFATKYFTGDGTTTTFTLDQSVPGANEANVEVFVENVQQNPIDAYTIGGALNNQLIFSEAPSSAAAIYVIHKGEATYNLQPSTGSVTAATLDPVLRNFTVDKFTGTGSQTAFTLTDTPYSVNSILVSVDGIVQQAGTNYTVSGTTLTFVGEAPDLASDITIVHLGFSSGNKAVMDASITPVKLSTGGPTWNTAGQLTLTGPLGVGQTTPTEKIHVLDGKIAVQGDTTTPTTGHAFFYKQSYGATMSGYQAVIETGSAGSRSGKMYVTFDGKVGVATSSPAYTLQVAGSTPSMGVSGSNTSQLYITNSFTGASSWRFINPDNTFGTPLGSLGLWNDTTQNYPIQFLSTGTVNLPMGQIKFPATQNASSDANTLDDYEEGSWSPTVNLLGTVSYSQQNGRYVKIGRYVTLTIYMTYSSTDSTQDSNVMYITNLPYAVSSSGQGSSCLLTERMFGVHSPSAVNTFHIQPSASSTSLLVLQNNWNSGVTNGSYFVSQQRSCYKGGNQYMIGTITYEAAS